jgi:MtN3 and saliva related transmembrane protein
MTTPEVLAVIATMAGFIMALSPALQIRRMRRTRSSRDVSLLYLSLLDLGFVAWISYGWSIGNWALILSNSASLTFMTITILVAIGFRRRERNAVAVRAPAVAAATAGGAPPTHDRASGGGSHDRRPT